MSFRNLKVTTIVDQLRQTNLRSIKQGITDFYIMNLIELHAPDHLSRHQVRIYSTLLFQAVSFSGRAGQPRHPYMWRQIVGCDIHQGPGLCPYLRNFAARCKSERAKNALDGKDLHYSLCSCLNIYEGCNFIPCLLTLSDKLARTITYCITAHPYISRGLRVTNQF